MKVIYLVRHACGQVHSHMRGLEAGKMSRSYLPPRPDMGRLFAFDRPAEDLVEDDFDQLEINAYRWAVFTDVNYRAMADLPNARVVTYETLCADPGQVFRDLFEWAGLEFHENCARFIDLSLQETGSERPEGYHTLIRNPMVAANKWREEMDPALAGKVKEICRSSAAAGCSPILRERRHGVFGILQARPNGPLESLFANWQKLSAGCVLLTTPLGL